MTFCDFTIEIQSPRATYLAPKSTKY